MARGPESEGLRGHWAQIHCLLRPSNQLSYSFALENTSRLASEKTLSRLLLGSMPSCPL